MRMSSQPHMLGRASGGFAVGYNESSHLKFIHACNAGMACLRSRPP